MKTVNLTCKPILNGIMAYWEGVDDASQYIITLYVNEQSISTKINERTEKYCAFTGLAAIDGQTVGAAEQIINSLAHTVGCSRMYSFSGYDYYIQVQAEDRQGKVIAQSEKVQCSVKEI